MPCYWSFQYICTNIQPNWSHNKSLWLVSSSHYLGKYIPASLSDDRVTCRHLPWPSWNRHFLCENHCSQTAPTRENPRHTVKHGKSEQLIVNLNDLLQVTTNECFLTFLFILTLLDWPSEDTSCDFCLSSSCKSIQNVCEQSTVLNTVRNFNLILWNPFFVNFYWAGYETEWVLV